MIRDSRVYRDWQAFTSMLMAMESSMHFQACVWSSESARAAPVGHTLWGGHKPSHNRFYVYLCTMLSVGRHLQTLKHSPQQQALGLGHTLSNKKEPPSTARLNVKGCLKDKPQSKSWQWPPPPPPPPHPPPPPNTRPIPLPCSSKMSM